MGRSQKNPCEPFGYFSPLLQHCDDAMRKPACAKDNNQSGETAIRGVDRICRAADCCPCLTATAGSFCASWLRNRAPFRIGRGRESSFSSGRLRRRQRALAEYEVLGQPSRNRRLLWQASAPVKASGQRCRRSTTIASFSRASNGNVLASTKQKNARVGGPSVAAESAGLTASGASVHGWTQSGRFGCGQINAPGQDCSPFLELRYEMLIMRQPISR